MKEAEWEPGMSDLVKFVAVELAICFYGISPTKYFKLQSLYPLMAPGGMGTMSINEYHKILDYCGRAKAWEQPETGKWKNPHLRYMFQTKGPMLSVQYTNLYVLYMIEQNRYDMTDELYGETFAYFANLYNTPDAFTMLTLDDDVVRAASKMNARIGYPITRIPNRKIGINVDGVGDPITGVVLGGFVDSFTKEHGDVVKAILMKLTKHKDFEALKKNPDLGHIVLLFDRGYFLISHVELITLCGANTMGTCKR